MSNGFRLPSITPFNVKEAQDLVSEFDGLTTFADVEEWDARASVQLKAIEAYLITLSTAESEVNAAEVRVTEAANQRSVVRRLWGPLPEVKLVQTLKSQMAQIREVLGKLSDQLESAIDKTPNSREEQIEMLRELKLEKKELAFQKRQAVEAKRQITTSARQQSAQVGAGFLGAMLTNPKSRRVSRMGIRLRKEAALAPHENLRTQLEKQILVIDRAIHWVERFRGE